MRIEDDVLYNPFGWRIAEIADRATDDPRRRELLEALVVCEAEELAAGRRHLTIVHGDLDTLADSRHLTAFYDVLGSLASAAEWARVRGTAEYVTVTIGGADAEQMISLVATAAARADPGWWRITESPYPTRPDRRPVRISDHPGPGGQAPGTTPWYGRTVRPRDQRGR